jgi:hypothetical protein
VNSKSNKNRRDHYLPQGYLRGFIDPTRQNHARPLWHLDIPTGAWAEKSPREVGYRHGFYDYLTHEVGVETADSVFAELERKFPLIREDLISRDFQNWKDQLDFLLRYAQMMRARSLLFFDKFKEQGKYLRVWTVEEVSPDRRSVRVRSMTPEPLSDAGIKNWTITNMCDEIRKGAAWLRDFNWCLRYSDSPAMPFIISEIPFIASGPQAEVGPGLQDPDTLLLFPLCWRACLIGSRQFFEKEMDRFPMEDMRRAQKIYQESANIFVLSPRQLEFS